jgi:hypothetical protein
MCKTLNRFLDDRILSRSSGRSGGSDRREIHSSIWARLKCGGTIAMLLENGTDNGCDTLFPQKLPVILMSRYLRTPESDFEILQKYPLL